MPNNQKPRTQRGIGANGEPLSLASVMENEAPHEGDSVEEAARKVKAQEDRLTLAIKDAVLQAEKDVEDTTERAGLGLAVLRFLQEANKREAGILTREINQKEKYADVDAYIARVLDERMAEMKAQIVESEQLHAITRDKLTAKSGATPKPATTMGAKKAAKKTPAKGAASSGGGATFTPGELYDLIKGGANNRKSILEAANGRLTDGRWGILANRGKDEGWLVMGGKPPGHSTWTVKGKRPE